MSALIPLDAIDPDAGHREWVRSFEWHLDLLPPVIDAVVMMTLPNIRATQLDKVRVSGGGYLDNVNLAQLQVDEAGRLVPAGAAADARELWAWVTGYTAGVAAWITTDTPAPTLPATVDADPLTARTLARTAIVWLIDHAALIEPVHELDAHREEFFALLRRLRGRYGVSGRPYRPRARCAVCGGLTVAVVWVDNPNGGPKPVQAGKCRTCGQIYTGEAAA